MTIGDLEKQSGISNREAFWLKFSKIQPAGASLDAGVARLKELIQNQQTIHHKG